ncbi:MAG: 2-oxoglutarate dehydrogenase complex dihydrolipoyllysine-residue succinyltransferase [Gammaproteobacteria bacterium]|nr:2-oxoglutarate dehydrogenase complex dihydrolipoyllysine-residue succinyltransferase [Gammaproteobacteria bacterium]
MTIEVKVPQLPESVTDATLVTWHKQPGQTVQRDENLVDLETDKVVLEVPAPANGVLKAIEIENGATVTSGQLLALLEPGEGAAPAPETEKVAAAATPAAVAATPATNSDDDSNAEKLSPAVRRLLEEHDIDATMIGGTGRGGRVLKSDVLDYINRSAHPEAISAEMPLTPELTVPAAGERSDHRVPMTRLRTRIAERMVEAQQTAAMLTTFNEIDLTEVMALRSRYKESFEKKHGVKLGLMSFFVGATLEALRRFPIVNASVEGNEIVYHDYYDVGIAVSSERGLIVPVIRNADQLNFAEIESSIREYGLKAREGNISMDDLTGGTFTITNGGVFGSMMSTPILNPPQSGILGMHSIQQRPAVVNGEILARPMMYVALTYDHRIIDGSDAVQFLVTIKQSLEDPGRLLLQV